MSGSLVKLDIEGQLVQFASPSPLHYGKRLSTKTAWHVFEPRDLETVAGTPVQAVRTNAAEAVHEIHYHPTLTRLPLAGLRELLRLEAPLATWRVTKLALDLAADLKALHDEEIPQLIIHPERIGQLGDRFALLPTLAGVLPPLADAPPNKVAGWLHFIAPEVLRTRGTNRQLMFAGDVYALGRTLEALCLLDWEPDVTTDWFTLAERCVETCETSPLGALPAELSELRDITTRMTALLPAARPTLDVAQAELAALARRVGPAEHLGALLAAGRKDEFELGLNELTEMDRVGVFGSWGRTARLCAADLALAQTPPDCPRAITELHRAESYEIYELDVQQRLAKAYQLHTDQSDHLLRSSDAYALAASLSGWAVNILEDWMPVLWKLNQPDIVLDLTQAIPIEKRTRGIVTLRAQCWEQKKAYLDAWCEIAISFASIPFDAGLYELARRIAQLNDSLTLVKWMTPYRNKPAYAAPESLVWEMNGNRELADLKLSEAQAYTPPAGELKDADKLV